MHLVMFDIDGTLTETVKVDDECFVRSLTEVCGFTDIETDWSRYQHTTDSGIFVEIHEARTGRPPSAAEISHFRLHFVDLLVQASSESAFAPIQGASRLLSGLACSAEHRVSLSTGGWRDSARLKMASAGMCFDDHPTASAEYDAEMARGQHRDTVGTRRGSWCAEAPCGQCRQNPDATRGD